MRNARLWARLLGVEKTVVEGVEFDEDAGVVVASVRPGRGQRRRCGVCGRRCPGYDRGEGRRRWRALDWGTVRMFVEADAPRVRCVTHGVVVAAVPWARHGAGHTRGFDQTVAWLATVCAKSAVTELMRVAWRTVGAVVARVWADVEAGNDLLAGLRRVGIDEISYRKGRKYLLVVVDHDSGRLVWVANGANQTTLGRFFDLLGERRCAEISHVSCDGARWMSDVITAYCPQAVRCADPYHVVAWATEALDVQRRQSWNAARGAARGISHNRRSRGTAKLLNNARWALWKNPENLSERQREQLAWIARTDPVLHRAWALKEGLRTVFAIARRSPAEAVEALDRWISWARRCRIPGFVKLQQRIVRHRHAIIASIEHRLSNAIVESTNTKIRLIIRRAYGFHSADAVIALAMLTLGGHRPNLPAR
ncbi:ISL3 family transposase [Micromonospora sp. NBC_01796]|uniref:ISL3 family transposase n=1 Tax=Micromonospora sp. NBC_01796 TaxID=2975987 RepID=UPI002DDB2D05|nr:ISL3 family transposase [Micromonospora sp. NBC_01796]WSA89658.1 ISL3 family transposase [Micromonospora sp. NBC_01796]WSA89711.1 ISL3 family transposase [Micromonospora sp. NBC_01796]WSA89746.1 ISL3 family transposase [Micromonospora sp. NBC_01796]WSA89817.1 ISL3 family transposase [Micromonospora sp. NBC_01796]